VDLAEKLLFKLPPEAVVELDGVGTVYLNYTLPVVVHRDHWEKFSRDSHQVLFNQVYFSTDPSAYDLTPDNQREFLQAIGDLMARKKVLHFEGDPPPSPLLEYALKTPQAFALLQAILTNQEHAQRWILRNPSIVAQLVSNNPAAKEFLVNKM
jgi:hypothetical protein